MNLRTYRKYTVIGSGATTTLAYRDKLWTIRRKLVGATRGLISFFDGNVSWVTSVNWGGYVLGPKERFDKLIIDHYYMFGRPPETY